MSPGMLYVHMARPRRVPATFTAASGNPRTVERFESVEDTSEAFVQHFADETSALEASHAHVSGDTAVYVGQQLADTGPAEYRGSILMVVAFDVPADQEDEVDRWYAEEHIRLLMLAPGWIRARRYRCIWHSGGAPFTSIAMHELDSVSVLDSEERAHARSTPWRAELAKHPWFANAGRFLYKRADAGRP